MNSTPPPDPAREALARPNSSRSNDGQRALEAVEAVLDILDQHEQGALRWAHPLPVPWHARQIREAITDALTGDSIAADLGGKT